jgi:hypothetical protein
MVGVSTADHATGDSASALGRALVAEATRKAAVVWVTVGARPAYAVWCLPVGEALFVVTGAGEQDAPGLTHAGLAAVTARGDHGGQIVTWPVRVTTVDPSTERWREVVPALAAKRLNATGSVEEVAARWARDCTVLALDPTDHAAQAAALTAPTT